jgi:short-subunit dehydrogenase
MFRTNVLASFRITMAVARSMVELRRGHIIVMSRLINRTIEWAFLSCDMS